MLIQAWVSCVWVAIFQHHAVVVNDDQWIRWSIAWSCPVTHKVLLYSRILQQWADTKSSTSIIEWGQLSGVKSLLTRNLLEKNCTAVPVDHRLLTSLSPLLPCFQQCLSQLYVYTNTDSITICSRSTLRFLDMTCLRQLYVSLTDSHNDLLCYIWNVQNVGIKSKFRIPPLWNSAWVYRVVKEWRNRIKQYRFVVFCATILTRSILILAITIFIDGIKALSVTEHTNVALLGGSINRLRWNQILRMTICCRIHTPCGWS